MARDPVGKLLALLEQWRDTPVAVRIVAPGDVLIAVFSGRLGVRSNEKAPAHFWPVHIDGPAPPYERPGIYAHPDLVSDLLVHPGGFVVEFSQAGVTVNVRRLDRSGTSA
jgi:hypothetical protein